MKKVFYIVTSGIIWLTTACTSTAYFRTSSGYTDDLYESPREIVVSTDLPATAQVEASRPAPSIASSQPIAQNQVEEIDMSQYYPGMFEEALTGTIAQQPETKSVTNITEKDSTTNNIIININYEDPWAAWDNFYYRPSWYFSRWGWGISWGPSWSWNYNPWWGAWYDPWYDPWYHWYDPWYRPWYGYNAWYDPWYHPWHGPWQGHYWHPHYESGYRNRIAYTGNRRPGNVMIGGRPVSSQSRPNSYESSLTRRPGNTITSSSRTNISSSRPTQSQINSSRVTTRRSSGTRTESNSSNISRRPSSSSSSSNSWFNNSSSSRPSYSNPTPIRTPSSSFSRGSSTGISRGSGMSSGSGGGVRRR